MLLNEEEKARIIALGMRTAEPESGFEKHFLRAIDGAASPCSPREAQWFEYFEQWYCDRVNSRVGDVLDEAAEESLMPLNTRGDAARPAHKGRRRSARRSGRRIVPSRAQAAASQGTPPSRRRRVSGSRRAK